MSMYNREVIEYLAELFSQVMVGGLNPVLSKFCYLLLSDNFNLWHINNTNKWWEAESAWDIPYLSRKIFLFHYQILLKSYELKIWQSYREILN